MRPGSLAVRPAGPMELACIVQGSGSSAKRLVVVHPLWRMDDGAPARLLGTDVLPGDKCVDTFELERRPLKALEVAQERIPSRVI